ncbi:alkaline ceramidase [Pediococcus ethanolidurans]|uniref:neutral/alkaline non-lysosomal ceramidase N-terminal domain-containing protein n=1 Tax=Pediococcus ethanolidurans TaxID=319653 RepID=UPI002953958F|nr:neutral/alkaline non-lysosomal ceramidase N-terminal domain-containing protein [Pediococcus ethanolidurans]MDV7718382.1 alkaline ceramidase [Pediococcus ethanolidurans]
MKVGSARFDITPKSKNFYLLGYKTPLRNEPAKGIHDHIFCNALLFDHDGNQVFLLTADLLEFEDETAEYIKTQINKRYGISRDQIIIGVTHDHNSVRDFHKHWEFGKYNQKYYDFLTETMIEAVETCRQNLRTAKAKYGKKVVTGFYSNRNHPGQLADNEILVIRFFDKDDKPFAALVNWATHSTVLGPSNMELTGDLAGQTCQKLGDKWGYYPVMVVGAAADCSNRNDRQGKDFAELDRATTGLANAIDAISVVDTLALGDISVQTLSHGIYPDVQSYHRLLRETVTKIRNGNLKVAGNIPAKNLIEKCTDQLDQDEFGQLLQFSVLTIGHLRFFVFPGELGSKFGFAMKKSTNKICVIAGYSNGFHYYFLPREEYGLSFETIGNPVPAGEGEKITAKFVQSSKLLDEKSRTN